MAYSTPRTWTTGELVTAAMMNQDVRDNVSFLYNTPAVRAKRSSTFPVPESGATIVVDWQLTDYDYDGMWSGINPSRLTVQTPGVYGASWWFRMGGAIYDRMLASLFKQTAGLVIARMDGRQSASQARAYVLYGEVRMAVGNYFNVDVLQQNTTDATIDIADDAAFTAHWIRG